MGVINDNNGPVGAETSVVQTNSLAVLENIWLELKVISVLLRQGLNIKDEDAGIRNSLTVNDLTLVQ